jgi:hypothetical protein
MHPPVPRIREIQPLLLRRNFAIDRRRTRGLEGVEGRWPPQRESTSMLRVAARSSLVPHHPPTNFISCPMMRTVMTKYRDACRNIVADAPAAGNSAFRRADSPR